MKLEKELKEVFDFYSQSSDPKNRTISITILKELLQKMNIPLSSQDLQNILKGMNIADSNNINYKEFVTIFESKLYKEVEPKAVVEAFELFDKDKSGQILITDFEQILTNLSENMTKDEIKEFLTLADRKGDGFIHYKDFVEFLSNV